VFNVRDRDKYTIDDAYRDTVEQVDFEHNLTLLTDRVQRLINEHRKRGFELSTTTRKALEELGDLIGRFLRKK
jgi:hypothetical protein